MLKRRTFPAASEHLSEIRTFILQCARRDSFSRVSDDLVLAASEACANVVLHAGSPVITVSWKPKQDRVELTIEDRGVFRRQSGLPEVDGIGHRGMPLMMATMDEVTIAQGSDSRPGTRVKLIKNKPRPLADID